MSLNQLFEAKKRLYPQAAKGKFRNLKSFLNIIFLSIYCFTPFLRFNRGDAPDQAILFDISNSRIYFFNIEIWPQEVYYLAGILILAAVALFFVTSLFGRIWCGYSCFQTVWTDIFIGVEKFFQGDRNSRIILDRKNNFKKFYKKFLTHACWIIISLFTGFFFTAYFNDIFLLIKDFANYNFSITIIGWILGIAASTYIMAGFAREHVCIYMCPYSRFQSAMFDRDTLIISYDEKRGEPRGKLNKNNIAKIKPEINAATTIKIESNQEEIKTKEAKPLGDCIDCKQCVVVCPQGIDIRNGLQMECIACGLCIDACDEIMDKIGKPRGLIRYDTEAHMQQPTTHNKFRLLKPRTFYYGAILLLVSFIMIYNLNTKSTIEVSAIADRNPLFVKLSDGAIRNGYTLKISNKTHSQKIFSFKLLNYPEAEIKVQSYEGVSANNLPTKGGEVATFKIYIALSKEEVAKTAGENIIIDAVIIDELRLEKRLSMVFVIK